LQQPSLYLSFSHLVFLQFSEQNFYFTTVPFVCTVLGRPNLSSNKEIVLITNRT